MIYQRFCQNILTYLEKPTKIVAAISGGSDSMALCVLLERFIKEYGGELYCITIDHNLRAESSQEANKVGQILNSLAIKHKIIPWLGTKPKANIQEKARLARYELLTDYCQEHNIPYLSTGHQKNDQAENFIIRAEHGSGVYGLSGIPRIGEFNNIKTIRPLLDFKKSELQEYLKSQNIEWIEDPSNLDEKFTRVKIRKILNQYPEWVDKLATVSDNLARVKECVEYLLNKTMNELVEFCTEHISIKINDFNELPQEIKFRMLMKILQNSKPARGERIERLIEKIASGPNFKASTLSGCLITRKKDKIIISREKKD